MIRRAVTIVDYGLCNIDLMVRALEECGAVALVTRTPQDVERAERIVLPGVGSFRRAMENLNKWDLAASICAAVSGGGVPFLGVCLGMQLMASRGLEHGDTLGLQLVEGVVEPLKPADGERIPHIGWNEITEPSSVLFAGIAPRTNFYFVHSFHLQPSDPAWIVGSTPYAGGFAAAIGSPGGKLFGTQFHPEKSQKAGFRVLRNFLSI